MPLFGFRAWLRKHGLRERHHRADREEEDEQTEQAGPAQAESSKKPTMPTLMSKADLTSASIEEAIRKANGTLDPNDYALIGGVGCTMMGSGRGTADFDFWVKNGQKEDLKKRLKGQEGFDIEPRSGGARVWFKRVGGTKNHNVDVVEAQDLSPHGHLPDLDTSTMVERINGVNVAKPQVMLLFKLISWMQREDKPEKQTHDTQDILFLLGKCVEEKEKHGHGWQLLPALKEKCDPDFMLEFEQRRPDAKAKFQALGLQ